MDDYQTNAFPLSKSLIEVLGIKKTEKMPEGGA